MNCPKCGFSQPKDRYCASCGVDMETFEPAPTPLVKRIVTNPAFLTALAVVIFAGSFLYIRQKERDEIASRAEMLRSAPVIVAQNENSNANLENTADSDPSLIETDAQNEVATDSVNGLAGAELPPSEQAAVPTTAETVQQVASAGEDGRSKEAPPAAADKKTARDIAAASWRLEMSANYVEIDKSTLAQLLEESRATGQFTDFGDFKSGALPNLGSRFANLPGVKLMHKISRTFDAKVKQHKWFVGSKVQNEEEVGLTTLMLVDQTPEGRIRGEVEILRSFHEGTDGVVKKSYPISAFDIPANAGWFLNLSLPKTDQAPEQVGVEGLLRLFKSSRFIGGETEFTLFLNFDTRTP